MCYKEPMRGRIGAKIRGPSQPIVSDGTHGSWLDQVELVFSTVQRLRSAPRCSEAMLGARQRLVAIGTAVVLVATTGSASGPPAMAGRSTPRAPRYLIHLIDGSDPIVVQKYVEEDGQIRFEKYGGSVSIPSSEVRRIVPDDGEETPSALPP